MHHHLWVASLTVLSRIHPISHMEIPFNCSYVFNDCKTLLHAGRPITYSTSLWIFSLFLTFCYCKKTGKITMTQCSLSAEILQTLPEVCLGQTDASDSVGLRPTSFTSSIACEMSPQLLPALIKFLNACQSLRWEMIRQWNFICILLIMGAAKHRFVCLKTIWVSTCVNCLFMSFANFSIWFFFLSPFLNVLSILRRLALYLWHLLQIIFL